MGDRRITNAEYIVNMLMDMLRYEGMPCERVDIDDGGASIESTIYYNIDCPYGYCDERCECLPEDEFYKKSKNEQREICVSCKTKWLLSEVDE